MFLSDIKYGWLRDLPDQRDISYMLPKIGVLPSKTDLRLLCPPVVHQGNLGSCTANAIASCFWFNQNKQKIETFYPSRLFIYYNERKRESSIPYDGGAMLRTGMKSIAKEGTCPEVDWPYIESKFADKPTKSCYKHAKKHQVIKYMRMNQNIIELKSCLATGYPFVFGFAIFDSFEKQEVAETGIVPMPNYSERLIGGHAVMAVGYDDVTENFLVLNSWGREWGMNGYFLLPYAYVINQNLAADFWTIKLVEGK